MTATGGGAWVAVGTVTMWAGDKSNVPDGWLVCDGTVYEQGTEGDPGPYNALFMVIGQSFSPPPTGVPFDESTQFCVPDLRGVFIRGVDDGSGRDPDAGSRVNLQNSPQTGVGSRQADELAGHAHRYQQAVEGQQGSSPGQQISPAFADYDYGGDMALFENTDWGPSPTETIGGNETRPVNVAIYFIIKAQ